MKTRRSTGKRGWMRRHHRRRRATSGRSCSLAWSVFFEADPFALEKAPQRVARDDGATRFGQFVEQSVQGEIRLLSDARKQPIALLLEKVRTLAAHRLCRWASGEALSLGPLHHCRWDDVVQLRGLVAAHPARHLRHNTLTQVERVGSSNACWPPLPACSLNQIATDLGIPWFRHLHSSAPQGDANVGTGTLAEREGDFRSSASTPHIAGHSCHRSRRRHR